MDLIVVEFQLEYINLKLFQVEILIKILLRKIFKLEKNNLFKICGNGLLRKYFILCCYGRKVMQKGYCFFKNQEEEDRDKDLEREIQIRIF